MCLALLRTYVVALGSQHHSCDGKCFASTVQNSWLMWLHYVVLLGQRLVLFVHY